MSKYYNPQTLFNLNNTDPMYGPELVKSFATASIGGDRNHKIALYDNAAAVQLQRSSSPYNTVITSGLSEKFPGKSLFRDGSLGHGEPRAIREGLVKLGKYHENDQNYKGRIQQLSDNEKGYQYLNNEAERFQDFLTQNRYNSKLWTERIPCSQYVNRLDGKTYNEPGCSNFLPRIFPSGQHSIGHIVDQYSSKPEDVANASKSLYKAYENYKNSINTQKTQQNNIFLNPKNNFNYEENFSSKKQPFSNSPFRNINDEIKQEIEKRQLLQQTRNSKDIYLGDFEDISFMNQVQKAREYVERDAKWAKILREAEDMKKAQAILKKELIERDTGSWPSKTREEFEKRFLQNALTKVQRPWEHANYLKEYWGDVNNWPEKEREYAQYLPEYEFSKKKINYSSPIKDNKATSSPSLLDRLSNSPIVPEHEYNSQLPIINSFNPEYGHQENSSSNINSSNFDNLFFEGSRSFYNRPTNVFGEILQPGMIGYDNSNSMIPEDEEQDKKTFFSNSRNNYFAKGGLVKNANEYNKEKLYNELVNYLQRFIY